MHNLIASTDAEFDMQWVCAYVSVGCVHERMKGGILIMFIYLDEELK